MKEAQRNAVWKTLALLALPVGILAGEVTRALFALDKVGMTVCVAAVILTAAVYIKEGGKPKDEE